MGWLNDFSWLEAIKKKIEKKELTYENYLNEVKKYNTKSEFSKNSRKFYILGLKNGWNDNFFIKNIDIHISKEYVDINLEDKKISLSIQALETPEEVKEETVEAESYKT